MTDIVLPDPPVVSDHWRRRIQLVQRAAAGVAFFAVVVDAVVVLLGNRDLGAFPALALSACGVVLALRRPGWGLALTLAGVIVGVLLGVVVTTEWTIVVYTLLAATLNGLPAVASGVSISAALYVLVRISEGGGATSPVALTAASAAAAAAAIGGGLRAQWRYTVVLEERAADALAARRRELSRALVEERLRIARDLHDLIGHEVAVVNMHLGVAEVSLPADADRTAAELTAARGAVQSVLTQTQQILELLRRSDDEGGADQPGPGPAEVVGLVESFRRSGHEVDGDLGPLTGARLSPPVWLTVYRVLQEALTNAHRYGDGGTQLVVTPTDKSLRLSLTNLRSSDPARVGSTGGGHGLVGMRERVMAVGGRLEVSTTSERFRLTVTLPTIEGSQA